MASTFHVINPSAPRQAVDEIIRRKAEELRTEASRLSPRATGRLAESWKVEQDHTASYTVSTDVEYAPYVEFGTRYMHGAAMMGRARAKVKDSL
jgi:hypothetical protein